METQMETVPETETPCRPATSTTTASGLRRGARSTGLAARINSTEVQHDEHDEQIHDDKASGERTRSLDRKSVV